MRTTEEEVKEILDPKLNVDDLNITTFITTANNLINQKLEGNLEDVILHEIEKWLSAHFVTISVRQPQRYSLGDEDISYDNELGLGLDNTMYGQQAKLLDTTGALSSLGQKKASLTVVSGD